MPANEDFKKWLSIVDENLDVILGLGNDDLKREILKDFDRFCDDFEDVEDEVEAIKTKIANSIQ